jgi:ectoine hydroxylase-related dioxygenase (phytanoyl-CoA dioxygenase family)
MSIVGSIAKSTGPRALPHLTSNGHPLSAAPNRMGFLKPSDPADGIASLRDCFNTDGYLLLKGFLPRRDVLEFRRYVFAAFADTGLIAAGSDPADGIYSGAPDGDLVRRRLMEIVRSAAFEAFCLSPTLWRFMDQFLGGFSYLHKRKLLRHTHPGERRATPAHYDLVYLRGGTDRIVTSWIPIGDTPTEMGGLCYLEGSHALGRRLEAEFNAASGDLAAADRVSAYNKHMKAGGWISDNLPEMAEQFDSRWLVADYEAGDVMLHSPFMVHAATSNDGKAKRIRLSTDIRYQNVRDEIDARWGNHWSLDDML